MAVILFSAVYAAYEAIDRLVNPSPPGYLLATAIAGVVGFIGNEWVAVYRLRAGRRVGSAALVADGYHARIDGLTSLAVVAGVIGVALGFDLADPIVGPVDLRGDPADRLAVDQGHRAAHARRRGGDVVDSIDETAARVPAVREVRDVRTRWIGHTIRSEIEVGLAPDTTVEQAETIAAEVRHAVMGSVEHVTEVAVESRATRPRE